MKHFNKIWIQFLVQLHFHLKKNLSVHQLAVNATVVLIWKKKSFCINTEHFLNGTKTSIIEKSYCYLVLKLSISTTYLKISKSKLRWAILVNCYVWYYYNSRLLKNTIKDITWQLFHQLLPIGLSFFSKNFNIGTYYFFTTHFVLS